MYRAFTLIELLTVLSITFISIYFISPVIYRLQDQIILSSEIENIRSFFYLIQSKARYTKQNYSVNIKQDDKSFCIIAIKKIDGLFNKCNCFSINLCDIQSEYFIYRNISNDILLKSNGLYPKPFLSIDGRSGKLESKCLGLRRNNEGRVLQFDQNGLINVIQKKKRSKCS
ncbi:pilus assembly FimT family protein [Otariodibacter oris]|uniref:Prepilin peptidase dependent protein A n=1 Tax=Otariodibacter oris TaxID=1032623 RepID=A0A420XGH9_9PAST|nr:Type II secretory pathway, pseudopilin PulG [Otariodibacter oris]QGM80052.1 Type II secretory pathway, pseudopilin PulG [Otariodibacter oris]RKR71876.1 prepilin peptidase dependent protein A [Otariodibacter oris]